jgi:hypothetical protein
MGKEFKEKQRHTKPQKEWKPRFKIDVPKDQHGASESGDEFSDEEKLV